MPRTDAECLAARAPYSKPRPALPKPIREASPPTSERLEALLSHTSLRPLECRLALQYLTDHPTTEALAKAERRLEKLLADRQKNTPPGVRAMLNRIYNPAYAALYEPEMPKATGGSDPDGSQSIAHS